MDFAPNFSFGFDDDMTKPKSGKTADEQAGKRFEIPDAREERWRKGILNLLSRWPQSKVNPFSKLALLAEVTGPYVSRLKTACPKTDDPSPELCRLCAVLGVTPESLWASHLDIVDEVTLDPIEAAKRVAPFRAASKTPTINRTSDTDTMTQFSTLDHESKQIVKDLIRKLSRSQS